MRSSKFLVVGLMALLMLSATACNSEKEGVEDHSDDAMMEKEDDAMMEEGDAMEKEEADDEPVNISLSDGTLPAGFPADVHVFEGAEVTGSSRNDLNYGVNMLIENPADDVYDVYKAELEAKDWVTVDERDSRDSSGQRFLDMEKTDDRDLSVAFWYMDNGNLSIGVTVLPNN